MKIFGIFLLSVFVAVTMISGYVYGVDNVYDEIYKEAKVTDHGVKEITYDQFKEIKKAKQKYILLDVLSSESYDSGHIPGAKSFPLGEISKKTAAKKLGKRDNIVVYCGSFRCMASVKAAQQLQGLGYRILDYKGGLQEWQERENRLVK